MEKIEPDPKAYSSYEKYINENADAKFAFAIQWLPLFIAERCGVGSRQYQALLAFLETISVGPPKKRRFLTKLFKHPGKTPKNPE